MCPSSRLSSLNYRLHNSILCSKNCPSFPHTMALSYPFFPWRNHVGMWVRVGGTEPRVSRAFYLPFCLVEQASPPPARSSVDEWVSYPTIEFREGTGQVPLGPFLPRLGIYLTDCWKHTLPAAQGQEFYRHCPRLGSCHMQGFSGPALTPSLLWRSRPQGSLHCLCIISSELLVFDTL